MQPRPRIAFLFTSDREALRSPIREGREPDTALRGANHIPGARLRHTPKGLSAQLGLALELLRFDAVIASDGLPLGFLVSLLARLTGARTRWVYVAINASTLMRRHATHPIRLRLLGLFWKSFTKIVCLSRGQLEDFARIGVSRERLAFIPFGVDTDFHVSASQAEGGAYVVSAGRDSGRDYPTLLKAAKRSAHPFVIVATHRNIPPGMVIPENVTVRYNLSAKELRELYAQARLVVVPSKSEDTPDGSDCSGQTVTLEAMASGKAVIATDRDWIRDYFTPGEDLLVVPPNDPAALAEAINRLWSDPGGLTRLAASGREKTRTRYTTKVVAHALENLIENL